MKLKKKVMKKFPPPLEGKFNYFPLKNLIASAADC